MDIDFDKLKVRLEEIKKKSKYTPLDPLRGLTGELNRKVSAGLAGHRSGALTREEVEKIDKIQSEYDRLHRLNNKDKNKR